MVDLPEHADETPPGSPDEPRRPRRRLWRRLLRASLGLLGLALAVVVVAAAASQTRWFKNWLRGYVERSAAKALNGELSIGRLSGNLFTGIRLDDVVLRQDGTPIITIATVEADYSLRDIVDRGIVIDRLVIGRPVIRASQSADGWNLTRLVKTTPGGSRPGRLVEIASLTVYDGVARVAPSAPRKPTQIADLDLRLRFGSRPGDLLVHVAHVSFDLSDHATRVGRATGRLVKRGSTLVLDSTRVDLPQSHLRIVGEVRDVGSKATLDFRVASEAFSFPEVGKLVPGIGRIALKPAFTATVRGPFARMDTTLALRSSGGDIDGRVVVALEAPSRRIEADATVTRLNPAPWSGVPALEGSMTGRLRATIPLAGQGVSGTFHFEGPEARAAGYEASSVDARGRFAGARVQLEPSTARAYGAAVVVSGVIEPSSGNQRTQENLSRNRGNQGNRGIEGRDGVQYALAGRVANLDLRRLPASLPMPDLATDLAGDYRVTGGPGRGVGEIQLAASTIEGAQLADGAKGHIEWMRGTLRYGSSGAIENLDLVRLGGALKIPALTDQRFAGRLGGTYTVDASGRSLDTLGLTADLSLRDSSIVGAELPGVTTAHATIQKRGLTVDLDSTFASLEPDFVSGRPALAGELNGTIKGRVTLADLGEPQSLDGLGFRGVVDLRTSRFGDLEITTASLPGALAHRALSLESATIVSPDGVLKATGTLALSDTGASNLRYGIDQAMLARVGRAVGQTLAGTASSTGNVTGNATELVLSGTAHVDELSAIDRVTVKSTDATYRVRLPDLEGARARIESTVQATGVQAAGQSIDTVEGSLDYEQRRLEVDAKAVAGPRTLESRATVLFEDGRQTAQVSRLMLASGGQTWTLAGTAPASVVYDGREVTLSALAMVNGPQQVDASGTLALNRSARSSLRVRMDQVQLADLEAVHGRAGLQLSGVLSGVADVAGTRDEPEVAATFGLQRGTYRELAFDRLAGDVRYGRGTVKLDVHLDQQPGATLAAEGSVPLALFSAEDDRAAAGQPIDLRVRSSAISLDIVTGLTKVVRDVGGVAQIDLHVTGTADNPQFAGGLSVRDGRFFLVPAGRSYSGLTSEFRFEPGRLIIDGLRVSDDGNDPLNVTGELGVRRLALGEMSLTVVAQSFGIMRNVYGNADANAVLTVTGTLTRPRIVGDVAILSGRIEVDQVLARLTEGTYSTDPLEDPIPIPGEGQRPEDAKAQAAGAPTPAQPAPPTPVKPTSPDTRPLLAGLSIDLRVRVPDNLVLRGTNLRTSATSLGLGNINVTVGGDFRIRKNPGTPVALVGTVNTVRGSYDYRGRRFDILRDGRIQFQGAQPIDPAIDITAQRIIEPSGVEARIRLTGTARNPQLSFSSTPPLDESDILALIVFNRDLNSLGTEQRSSIATLAGTTAAGFVVAPLTESLGRALDLDQFEVQATSDGGSAGGVVTIGEQIGERLFFRFRQQFGAQEVSEFVLEYNLSRFLRLQASIAEGQGVGRANRSLTRRIERAGLDLIFYFSY